ncbi:selenate reductase YgfK [Pelosinus sp. UFO1]|nr:putative selenate reductase subunit YgfK [Pelosinus sp. UFO1]AIF51394.1 selenate reductase YgfK [Pelosinus sp. UFO1]
MSHTMKVQPFDVMLTWILREYEERQSIFGIHHSLFYVPKKNSPYAIEDLYGSYLATPIGTAAGPHTQLAQNIICTWLSGGRFIELKTVQIMDELEISRPCIDMEDEGYNVEWSQELKLDQSANEYIKAWALIHILHRLLGFSEIGPVGTIFNMSVGYNLEGIKSLEMTRFMNRMADAREEIAQIQAILNEQFPQFADVEIPNQLTNNVTLSTMHGCPPDEIGKIVCYLLEKRKLHTTVKLNPTLLGRERLLHIIHDNLGYQNIQIPDSVFSHDLQYELAIQLIKMFKKVAAEQKLTFGIKLTNTLAMTNYKNNLPGDEMYMSGRALYPIAMNLYQKILKEFQGDLQISYSAGADAFNLTDILASGAKTVTVASDLLKPGGYSRLLQYLENLENEMTKRNVKTLGELASNKVKNVEIAAKEALSNPRYKKDYHPYDLPKVSSELEMFDCITAPCKEQCSLGQDVPEYLWLIANGEYDKALEVILARNPLPAINGYICTHLCQTRCTRNNYDEPIAIRALKRFAVEKGKAQIAVKGKLGKKVAIIGGGPSGLAAASVLAANGIDVTIYEAKDKAGGMPAIAPEFRIPQKVVQEDIARIKDMGVKIELSHPIITQPEELLKNGFDAVYVACGFSRDTPLDIPGAEGRGVYGALDLLDRIAKGDKPDLGSNVLVIGGGNTAMDAARTVQQLIGKPVKVVYRRTKKEMPATDEEKKDLLEEGNDLIELATPTEIILQDGRVVALRCIRNLLGEQDGDGRRNPVGIPGSEFEIKADSIIIAIGQSSDVPFLTGSAVSLRKNGAIVVDVKTGITDKDSVYAGGDVTRGPAIVVQACADGGRAAEAICQEFGVLLKSGDCPSTSLSEEDILKVKQIRVRKQVQQKPEMLSVAERIDFKLVEQTFSEEAARKEASRCMQCSEFCDKCVEVCPNRANYTYMILPMSITLPTIAYQDEKLKVIGERKFQINQNRQIIHIDDFCNECGNCATFCVHLGKPYRDKPRLFLRERDFIQEDNNAFYIEGNIIRQRLDGVESKLIVEEDGFFFESPLATIHLSADFAIKEMEPRVDFTRTFPIQEVVHMALIFQGVTTSLPFVLNQL